MNEIDKLFNDKVCDMYQNYYIAKAKADELKASIDLFEKTTREEMLKFFEDNGITRFENDVVTISKVSPHVQRRLTLGVDDLKAVNVFDKNGELIPEDRLIKETEVGASLRIKFKEA